MQAHKSVIFAVLQFTLRFAKIVTLDKLEFDKGGHAMKKWYQWLYMTFIFTVGGIVNYIDGRQIIASVIQVGITLTLAFTQFLCDKNGEKGKKVFDYINIVAIGLLVIWIMYLVFSVLR